MSVLPPVEREIEYPSSDGKPLAETDIHRDLLNGLVFTLTNFFQDEPDVYVSGNLLLYYEQGNPNRSVSPDVFVVRGVGRGPRRVYKLWEEGRTPNVVIELSSRSTCVEDLQRKWTLYQRLGVREYFIFDPEYDYLERPLLGYRLREGQYEPLEVIEGRVRSEELGLELVDTGATLRLYDPAAGEFLLTQGETEAARRAEAEGRRAEAEARQRAEEALQIEAEARQQAEAELARLREEVERLRNPE